MGRNPVLFYIFFRTPTKSSWSNLPPVRCAWTRLLSSMPPTQTTRHYRWGNICVLFTFGNKWTSFYTTHTIYTALPQEHRLIYIRKQVHILLYHLCKLCGISKESSCHYRIFRFGGVSLFLYQENFWVYWVSWIKTIKLMFLKLYKIKCPNSDYEMSLVVHGNVPKHKHELLQNTLLTTKLR